MAKTKTVPSPRAAAEERLAEVESELADVRAQTDRWARVVDAKQQEIDAFERQAGEELLTIGPDADPEALADARAGRLARLCAERDTAGAAVNAAGARRDELTRLRLTATAAVLRARVGELNAGIPAHEARLRELLAEVERFDGVRYVPDAKVEIRQGGGWAERVRRESAQLEGLALVLELAATDPTARVAVGGERSANGSIVYWHTARKTTEVGFVPAMDWAERALKEAAVRRAQWVNS